ncbi:hypothetical protein, partial [Enterobacter hormaechei]|uniref:hypothetical protein n=1 Tax=Enterobacter hormaechei TaxID=158836 RepID=UPI0013CF6BA4
NGASEIQAQQRDATRSAQPPADRRSIITVDVLGPARDGRCEDRNAGDDPDCAPSGGHQPQ